jgi:HAD superfamily hydrolase (TIGR01549 family)
VTDYDTVLFDSDGVLVEPPAYGTQAAATRAAFGEVGVTGADRKHVDAVLSGVTTEQLRAICAAYDLDVGTFWEARERHDERSQLDDFESGSRDRYDDVAAIADLPQDRGVVSNNHHSTIEFVLDFFDLRPLFDTWYGREKTIGSLELKRPDPHYLHQALADLDAESALYVGDSEGDVLAARNGGIDSVFVRRAHCRDVVLPIAPTYEATDLRDVVALATE